MKICNPYAEKYNKIIHHLLLFSYKFIDLLDVYLVDCKLYYSRISMHYEKLFEDDGLNLSINRCLIYDSTLIFMAYQTFFYCSNFKDSKLIVSVTNIICIDNCIFTFCDLTDFVVGKIFEGGKQSVLKDCYVNEKEKRYYFTGTFSDLNYNHGFIKDYIIAYNKEHGNEGQIEV